MSRALASFILKSKCQYIEAKCFIYTDRATYSLLREAVSISQRHKRRKRSNNQSINAFEY